MNKVEILRMPAVQKLIRKAAAALGVSLERATNDIEQMIESKSLASGGIKLLGKQDPCPKCTRRDFEEAVQASSQ
jgi:hypothetical protein